MGQDRTAPAHGVRVLAFWLTAVVLFVVLAAGCSRSSPSSEQKVAAAQASKTEAAPPFRNLGKRAESEL